MVGRQLGSARGSLSWDSIPTPLLLVQRVVQPPGALPEAPQLRFSIPAPGDSSFPLVGRRLGCSRGQTGAGLSSAPGHLHEGAGPSL